MCMLHVLLALVLAVHGPEAAVGDRRTNYYEGALRCSAACFEWCRHTVYTIFYLLVFGYWGCRLARSLSQLGAGPLVQCVGGPGVVKSQSLSC